MNKRNVLTPPRKLLCAPSSHFDSELPQWPASVEVGRVAGAHVVTAVICHGCNIRDALPQSCLDEFAAEYVAGEHRGLMATHMPELPVVVEYEYTPAQSMRHDCPAADPEASVTDVLIAETGKSIMAAVEAEPVTENKRGQRDCWSWALERDALEHGVEADADEYGARCDWAYEQARDRKLGL